MEWITATNRIVLVYANPELRVLKIRSNGDGSYLDRDMLDHTHKEMLNRWTDRVNPTDHVSFVASIPEMQGLEGVVVHLASGQRIKIKTTWYLSLHSIKNTAPSFTEIV